MREKGFSSILLTLSLLVVMVTLGITFYVFKKSPIGNKNLPLNQKQAIQEKIGVGEELIKMLPGQTNITLPSGALITFGHTGTSESVPDFVYGDKYSDDSYTPNGIRNRNYLRIEKKLITFHNNYKYDITNEGCLKKQRFDIDVMITEVTECTLKVITTKEPALTTRLQNYSKQFSTIEDIKSISGRQSKPAEPLLYLEAYPIRVQKNIAGEIYISPGTEWDVFIVTNYGIETIRYTAEELWNKQTKAVQADQQDVSISIDSLTCQKLINVSSNNIKDSCPYFTEINFTVTLQNLEHPETPIKILEYR